MGKLLKFFADYKNAVFIFLGCIVITITGVVFTRGEYNHYNYERQTIKDCDMGWYEANDPICKDYKENQRKIDDQELNAGQIKIPAKIPFDYIMFLASILQVVFIATASFSIGVKYKKEKFLQLWKSFPTFLIIIGMCVLLNLLLVMIKGTFSSNDFLRVLFEIVIAMVVMILGRKI